MQIRPFDKRVCLSKISIEFSDHEDMYDLHDLRLQVHCTSPCTIKSSVPLTKAELDKLGHAIVLIQQRLNSPIEVPDGELYE